MTADRVTDGLDVYVVGGAVRDALLGLPPGDRDWVVLGTTPEQMAARGFIPVGGDFPVFLHPKTKEEYALARTERKSGRGYKGFTFYTGVDVTLEDDLVRRDLTVNAIAQHPDGRLVDPFGGQDDIKNKVLRHVGSAFAEDPVRLLRLARFAARFHDFSIAPETLALARRLVESGEVDALVPERVWREISKGLYTAQPGRMFEVLEITGALARVLPGFVFNREVAEQLAQAARADLVLAGRFALMCRLSPQPEQIGKRLKAPAQCQDYARLLPLVVAALPADSVEHWLELIERCDVIRKPGRFFDLIAAAACVVDVDADAWKDRVAAVRSIDAGAIAMRSPNQPGTIKAALTQARRNALSALIAEDGVRETMPAIAPNKAE